MHVQGCKMVNLLLVYAAFIKSETCVYPIAHDKWHSGQTRKACPLINQVATFEMCFHVRC